jgi:hypothetical protein
MSLFAYGHFFFYLYQDLKGRDLTSRLFSFFYFWIRGLIICHGTVTVVVLLMSRVMMLVGLIY